MLDETVGANPVLPAVWRILHVADASSEREVLAAHLRLGGLKAQIDGVRRRADYLARLDRWEDQPYDAILCDYQLQHFTGLEALDDLKASGVDVPFILISGRIGEDLAVQAMRQGASDYLLKGWYSRLVPALEHAAQAAQHRRAAQLARAALRESEAQLRQLTWQLHARLEHERLTMARELHDEVGGALTAVRMDLAGLEMQCRSAACTDRLNLVKETLSVAQEATTRCIQNLRPAILDQGLADALLWLGERFQQRTGIACTVRVPRPEGVDTLPATVPLVAYRFAQEALTNVAKHAQAKSVVLDCALAAQVLSVEVADDGQGIPPGALAKAQSFGLKGLRERAQSVGGWVDISSHAGGTVLILSIPLEREWLAWPQYDQAEPELPFWAQD